MAIKHHIPGGKGTFWPPYTAAARADRPRQARDPSPLDPPQGAGRGSSDQRSDSLKWANAERAEGERPADIQTAE